MEENDEKIQLECTPKEDNKFTLQWHITESCNLRCKHCYQNEDFIKNELSFDNKLKIIDQLVYFCSKIKKTPRIAFTGGEPFIKKDELYKLIEYCDKKYPFIKKMILTNGTLIESKDIPLLKSLHVEYVQVSLDGATKETHESVRGLGNYDKALVAINLLKKGGIKTAVMFVFHKYNYKEVPQLIDLCDKLNVDALGITELVPIGRGKEIEELMLLPLQTRRLLIGIAEKQLELINVGRNLRIDMKRPLWIIIKDKFPEMSEMIGGGCAAGFSGLALLPNGDVMPCRRMNNVIANITKQNFFDIWYSSEDLWKLRERETYGECRGCKYNQYCSGCKATSLALYGDYLKTDPYCWYKNDSFKR